MKRFGLPLLLAALLPSHPAGAGSDAGAQSAAVAAADYPRLRAAAVASVERARGQLAGLGETARAISFPSVEMLLEDADRRAQAIVVPARDWDFVRQQLETARAYADALAAGNDPYRGATGELVKAYRAPEDQTLQPYALYVPRGAPPAAGWPLVVALHGAYSDHLLNLRRVFGLSNRPGESDGEASRNRLPLPDVPMLVVSPLGRGEFMGFEGLGEQDVLRVIADVRRAYAVDPDRIHLTGLSMGGEGTWHIGLRYPDLFASIVPVCGIIDPRHWTGEADRPLFDPALLALTSPLSVAENAGNQQVIIYHGDADPTVPVANARAMAERYRQLGWVGKNVRYIELPGVNHAAWEVSYRDGQLLKELAAIKRDPLPRRVTYKTFSLRYRQAYWLRIDGLARGLTMAEIDGERAGEPGAASFAVRVTNVAAFSLLLDPRLVQVDRPISVAVDGAVVYRGLPRPTLSFARAAGGAWKVVNQGDGAAARPDHGPSGLFSRALARSRAHLYVYGTAGRPEMTAANRALALAMADWGPGVRARFAVKSDREVSAEDLARFDLVLIGGARTNALVARMKDQLPVGDGPDRLVAGALTLTDADRAYRLAVPSPLGGHQWLIYAADTEKGLGRFQHFAQGNAAAWGPESSLDYLVYDGAGRIRLAGVFRDRWKIGE